jgi:hypothetical protein
MAGVTVGGHLRRTTGSCVQFVVSGVAARKGVKAAVQLGKLVERKLAIYAMASIRTKGNTSKFLLPRSTLLVSGHVPGGGGATWRKKQEETWPRRRFINKGTEEVLHARPLDGDVQLGKEQFLKERKERLSHPSLAERGEGSASTSMAMV